MDVIEKIRQLIALMKDNDLAELDVKEPELSVKVKAWDAMRLAAPPVQALPQHQPAVPALPQGTETAVPQERKAAGLVEISAPMVGTFFRASSEGAEPYVSVGSVLDPDSVVCIIEAMKVMNEVKSNVSGEVAEIVVQNAEAVEYGQVLFLVRPDEE